jgi:hypothetical protein
MNEIIIRTWNEDGPSLEKRQPLIYEKPVEPKPELIVETPEKVVVGRPLAPLQFRIRSAAPLTRVTLVRERSSATRVAVAEFPVESVARGADDRFEFRGDREIPLEPGPNSFTLMAENAGGVSSADLLFTYTTPPLHVVIDGVEPRAGGARLVPQARADGPPVLPEPLPDSAIVLGGRVIGTDTLSMHDQRDPRVQVWVNGFPHVLASLRPAVAGSPERAFRAEIVLSRLQDNEVALRLDGAPLDVLGDRKLLVSCRKVEPEWRLHLLVLGVGVVDQRGLRDRAIAALKGREFNPETGSFQTPAFPTARLYGLGRTHLSGPWLNSRLREIRRVIVMGPRPSNEVVILYYEGGEVIEDQEPYLRLRPGKGMTENDIFPLNKIRDYLSEARGAKLLLLDVTHAREQAPLIRAQALPWIEDETPFGLLRFSSEEPPAPPDVSLAATLRDALEGKSTLQEVSAELDRRSRVLRSRYPSLNYRPEFNRYFNRLVLGGGP